MNLLFSWLFCCISIPTLSLYGQTNLDSLTISSSLASLDSSSASDTLALKKVKHFKPVPDRWRGILPPPKSVIDPYNQNILKGDYPIIGQNVFFVLTATADNLFEAASSPIPSGLSTAQPFSQSFFGRNERFFLNENLKITMEIYKGNVAFKPRNWELKVTTVLNYNYINFRENNNVNINVRKGDNRSDRHIALQELSIEKHLFDFNRNFDFISFRGGIQFFNSDFRAFIFEDFNLGARLFGNAGSNRFQYNLVYFRMLEKDTNSELNTVFDNREQDIVIANLYKQDFLTLGYTTQFSFHYNHDKPTVHFDENGIPVRPSVLGNVLPHDIKAYYLGWTGDGHFGRLNINHAFYQVLGEDSFNSLAGHEIDINAQMAALELSVDKDWMRFKISGFFSSGDSDPMDDTGRGFDAILDAPFFAGGPFSYWNLQGIRLQGVSLVNKLSLVPNLRSNKIEGQANFVNPGLLLLNAGYDAELTPKLKTLININYLRFHDTAALAHFVNQPAIGNDIGIDYSIGFLYRPFLNNNAIFKFGAAALTPLSGFNDLYESPPTLFSLFSSLILTY